MTLCSKTLAAVLVAGSLPLFAGSVAAAPIGQSQGLMNAQPSSIEQVQWRGRRGGAWRGGRWIGPAVGGFAAGVAIGALTAPGYRYYDDGYYAYGAAPGYYVAPRYRYRGGAVDSSPQYGSCTGDRYNDSGFPSWACR
jgi:hypothetical protein